MKPLTHLFLILTVASVATPALAKGKHSHRKGKERISKMIEKLDLSEDQKKKIKEINKTARSEMKAARDKAHKDHEAFHTGVKEQKSDEELTKLHETMIASHGDKMRARLNKLLKIRAVLTKEQQVKFGEMMGKGKHGKRGKHGGSHGRHSMDDDED